MTAFHHSTAAYILDRCRADDCRELAFVESLVAAGDITALASNAHFAATVRILQARLPKARGLHNSGVGLVGLLYVGGDFMALRCAQAFGIIKADASTPTLSQTVRRIHAARGPAADACRALLTGVGIRDAVLLRRVIEARRGSALPVFDLTGGEP